MRVFSTKKHTKKKLKIYCKKEKEIEKETRVWLLVELTNRWGTGVVRVSPIVSKKNQHLKLYFAPKSNFLRFSLKLKGCELQQ